MPSKVMEFKDCTFSYEAAQPITISFYTDMPGSQVVFRVSQQLPATTGRQTHTITLDFQKGTLYKFSGTSAGAFSLFSGLLRWRPIGCYVDGTNGEIWYTQEVALA